MGLDIMYLRLKENNRFRKRLLVILAIFVLIASSGCSLQGGQETDGDELGKNLKEIQKGTKQFSKLRNGTLELNVSMSAEDHDTSPLVNGSIEATSLVTFISDRKGYDYLDEKKDVDGNSGKVEYSASKVFKDQYFLAFSIDNMDRTKPYDWKDFSREDQNYHNPGAFTVMRGEDKLLKTPGYIKDITVKKDGPLTEYTLTTNDTYAKYAEMLHMREENYTVIRHEETYWIDQEGILVKQRTFDKMRWTIEGQEDTYISDVTINLTGYNYKTLKKIGDELPPMIMFEGKLYTKSEDVKIINIDSLVQDGTIDKIIGSIQKPDQNNQANRLIKGAKIYKTSKDTIIVKDTDYTLYKAE